MNGADNVLPTTFVSNTLLTAVIPAALLSNPVKAQILVETGDPQGITAIDGEVKPNLF